MSKLIILKGNSGSGKTTTAKKILSSLPKGSAMLISQDMVRREILAVDDLPNNPSLALIFEMAKYGNKNFDYVIIEGIFSTARYKQMFEELYDLFNGNVSSFYFDISFEETLKRHSRRDKAKEFGEKEMKSWWLEQDRLNFPKEIIISENQSQDEVLQLIIRNTKGD